MDYHDKNQRRDALEEITEVLGKGSEHVKKIRACSTNATLWWVFILKFVAGNQLFFSSYSTELEYLS